jgi:hypothetical protein
VSEVPVTLVVRSDTDWCVRKRVELGRATWKLLCDV